MENRRAGSGALEVHEHWFTSGPRSNRGLQLVHSHADGDRPHQHADTGPACYTIDKDQWRRSTGMEGGGRKKHTAAPTGEQMALVELEDWQRSFEVVVLPESQQGPPDRGEGPGIAPAMRMILGHGMTAKLR